MAILRAKQVREMTPKDFDSKMSELRLELMKESGNIKMGKPIKNTGRVGELKRTVARMLTIKSEARMRQAKAAAAEKTNKGVKKK